MKFKINQLNQLYRNPTYNESIGCKYIFQVLRISKLNIKIKKTKKMDAFWTRTHDL